MISIAIVEDDELEASILEEYIKKHGEENKKEFYISKYSDAINLLNNYKPVYDIIFMDIEMPYLNGMEAAVKLRELDNVVTLIFVTNMANYAIKGYEVAAFDFIVKPVRYATFTMKFRKALARISANEEVNIVVSQRVGIVRLTSRKIIYIEVEGHRLTYHLSDGVVKGHGSLTDLEKQLQICNFLRCHASYLINTQYISHVQGDTVTMTNGDELRISRPRKKKVMIQLAQLLGEGKNIIL